METKQDKDQILKFLASGLAPSVVASAVGCSPSYVSQLLAAPPFQAQLEIKKAELVLEKDEKDRDQKLESIEHKLLDKVDKAVDLLYRPMEVLKFFQVINAARKASPSALTVINQPQAVVNINFPEHIHTRFKLNSKNQVIEAGSQTLVTMPAASLLAAIPSTAGVQINECATTTPNTEVLLLQASTT